MLSHRVKRAFDDLRRNLSECIDPPLPREVPAWVEFTVTMRVSIEPGNDLVGRFGDTVVLISRGGATDASANELLGLVADLASDREAPATAVAARLAGWVLGHIAGDVAAVRDRRASSRWRRRLPARPGAMHGERGRRCPGSLRRAGADLGGPDPSRHVRLAGDRRCRGHRGPGGPDLRPAGRRGPRAGLRAQRRERSRPGGGGTSVQRGPRSPHRASPRRRRSPRPSCRS